MNSAMEKVERIGGISLYRGNSFEVLRDYFSSRRSGVIVTNENSMIDTVRIDSCEEGLVGFQSIDLEYRLGNSEILEVVDAMLRNKAGLFFPGTLLRDFGNYSLQVMPVIQEGKLIFEKVKRTGIAYVDDYRKLAERFFGKTYAESIPSFSGFSYDEPMKSLLDRLQREVLERKAGSFRSVNVNGICVAPVIGNELRDFSQEYEGRPLDVLCHSTSNSFEDDKAIYNYYCQMLETLTSRGKINTPVIIALAEERSPSEGYSGLFVYDNGKLEQLSLKV